MVVELQKELKNRIEEALKDLRLPSPDYQVEEGTKVQVNVFIQDLPEPTEEDESLHPSVVIKISEGEYDFVEGSKVPVLLIITTYDLDEKLRGYENAMTIMNKLIADFSKCPLVSSKYRVDSKISWLIPDEDLHPYHYAAVQLSFDVPSILPEDDLVNSLI